MSTLNQHRAARALINDYRMRKRANFLETLQRKANGLANYVKDIDWTSDRAKRVYGTLGTAAIGGGVGALLGGKKGAVLGSLGGAGLGYGGMYGYQKFLRDSESEAPAKRWWWPFNKS